jgi:hypothetical protein
MIQWDYYFGRSAADGGAREEEDIEEGKIKGRPWWLSQ